ncbi:hypothetical protein FQR65_LT04632 [Abscondita terminalis]|nr:hypothetical protein FQR65_LT04632 [Abscondita terminalis]
MEVEIENINPSFRDCSEDIYEVPVINNDISYNKFFEKYFLKNRPCLIRNVGNAWDSSRLWMKSGFPNFSYLEQTYGELQVSVVDCKANVNYYNNKPQKWKFKEYLKYWKSYTESEEVMYLKDWHLKNGKPQDNFYRVPMYFSCDWLNEYLVENSLDDYRFVYMGVRGTWSPFHVDVMTSYSWSTNICGVKKWILFPPGEEKHLRNSLGNLPADINKINHNRKCFEVYQNAGDAMFVPSNWHHQVWNIKDTISINHNWFNGCNLNLVWQSMENNLKDIKNEIDDCKDMDNFLDHCQIMLKASFNLNFKEFFNVINYIAKKRLMFLNGGHTIWLTDEYVLGRNHAIFDLISIKCTLKELVNNSDVKELSCFKDLEETPFDLLHNIEDNT